MEVMSCSDIDGLHGRAWTVFSTYKLHDVLWYDRGCSNLVTTLLDYILLCSACAESSIDVL